MWWECVVGVMEVWWRVTWECGVCVWWECVSVLTGMFSLKDTMWRVGQVYLLTFDLTRS